jgi:hypothetical protein
LLLLLLLLLQAAAACQAHLEPQKNILACVTSTTGGVLTGCCSKLLGATAAAAAAVDCRCQAKRHLLATPCYQEATTDVAAEDVCAAAEALCAWCLIAALYLLQHTFVFRAEGFVAMSWGVGDALLTAAPSVQRAQFSAYMG